MTVTADLNVVQQTLNRIELIANEILTKLVISGDQIVVVGGLSDISEDLGLIKAGEFRSGVGVPGKGTGFTGVRIGSPGWTYGSTRYSIVGLNLDVLQFGLSSETGQILAQGGNIAGWTINTTQIAKGNLLIDSSIPAIKTADYSAGLIGFSINGAGDAEFANVRVRGEIRSTVFSYQELTATAGSQGIFKSAGKLRADATTATAPTTSTIDISDPASGHAQLFATNDILRIQTGTSINWVTVTAVSDQTTFYRYTVRKESGTNTTFRAGTTVVDYGPSGQGFLYMTADDPDGPFYSVRTHAGAPWTTLSELIRLGNLKNSFGIGANNYYGIGIGDYAGGNYFRYETNGGLILKGGAGGISIDNTGLRLSLSTAWASGSSVSFGTGTNPPIKFWGADNSGSSLYSGIWAVEGTASRDAVINLLSTSSRTNGIGTIELRTLGGSGLFPNEAYIEVKSTQAGGYSSITQSASQVWQSPTRIDKLLVNATGDPSAVAANSASIAGALGVTGITTLTDYLKVSGGLYSGRDADPGDGNVAYAGNLKSYKNSTEYTGYAFVPLTSPLTSGSYDGGDGFSTTSKTLIDLSAVFSAPAGIKAILAYVSVRDSGSAGADTFVVLSPNNTTNQGMVTSPMPVNDRWNRDVLVVPCDSNGDVYYQVGASGAGTMDIVIEIWGYWI